MEIEGRLLNFETNDALGYRFSKDCKIDIPDVIPIINGFNISDNGKVVGSAIVKKDENGLSVSGTIFDDEMASDNIDFGGYFTNIKMEKVGDVNIITEFKLRGVSIANMYGKGEKND